MRWRSLPEERKVDCFPRQSTKPSGAIAHLGLDRYSRLMALVFKIAPEGLWRAAEAAGVFTGAPVDQQDGFIHLSTADQVRETADRHFAGQEDLLLVAVAEEDLGPALRYEPSRGGALFPHLYGSLPVAVVRWV